MIELPSYVVWLALSVELTAVPIAATILVPTHNHGATLLMSVASALQQTVENVEVFIVGDGVTEETREAATYLVKLDKRVRFFDKPKASLRGEIHRHTALKEASGNIVCYLSDDDLWFPDHLEQMFYLLADSDFALSMSIACYPDGSTKIWWNDTDTSADWERMLSCRSGPPLSTGGHTLDLYRQLREGWTASPPGVPSDLYFWRKLVQHPGCRFRSEIRPTVLKFCSLSRQGWTNEARAAELAAWRDMLCNHTHRQRLIFEALDRLIREERRYFPAKLAEQESVAQAWRRSAEEQKEVAEAWRSSAHALEAQLGSMKGSRTWRLNRWLNRVPLFAVLNRALASARASAKAP